MPFLPSEAPRCLQPFSYRRVQSAIAGVPPDSSYNSYRLVCPCGSDVWRTYGYWIPDGKELDDPLDIECCRCHAIRRLIDLKHDGYDGEIGSPWGPPTGREGVWRCPTCNSTDGHLIASFGYHYEPFDADEPEAKRVQDFFDAFLLRHYCLNAEIPVEVATFECA